MEPWKYEVLKVQLLQDLKAEKHLLLLKWFEEGYFKTEEGATKNCTLPPGGYLRSTNPHEGYNKDAQNMVRRLDMAISCLIHVYCVSTVIYCIYYIYHIINVSITQMSLTLSCRCQIDQRSAPCSIQNFQN